ncbi:hypothetical protein EW146_g9538 [Bondarzewia mesenterica]|uniref:Coiled-coil domain-containing protein 16 n=1 Tax=Bondarzewia mesenterica TaxID=1095465 RepID=A0A4S4L5M2_9AGAM|nr:hypothetical protein EW146_g9538 [Bondarzewia mesenterica]
MSDVRKLLKAKRQEARVVHPYATYGAGGQLRCTACGVGVKVAWEGHVGSKAHRVNVARVRKEEEERRKVEEERVRVEEEEEERKRRVDGGEENEEEEGGFPADFFSDVRALCQ